MAFLSGILVIHAPASALNNAGTESGVQADNKVTVKKLRMGRTMFPYVSAQAWRYWLRMRLLGEEAWKASPIFREAKIAYTDAHPILYDDDDVFGYMRAPSKKKDAASEGGSVPTPVEGDTLTRVAPLRVGTFVGFQGNIHADFGTMSRHEGDPVPHEHEFYAVSLRGLFGLDLGRVGVFTASSRTGFQNLDPLRIQEALRSGAQKSSHNGSEMYILPEEVRWRRIATVLKAIPTLSGGAKQTLHATDVSPVAVLMAVFRGGINPFYNLLHSDEFGHAKIHFSALKELLEVWKDELLSPIYLGWVQGYPPENPKTYNEIQEGVSALGDKVKFGHPKKVFEDLIADMKNHPEWWKPELLV